MTTVLQTVTIPYDDCMKMRKDSADIEAVKSLIATEFPDDTCKLVAIKAVLGIVEEPEGTEEPDDEDTTGGTTV